MKLPILETIIYIVSSTFWKKF